MTLICEICGFKTVTEGGLRLHMKVSHSEKLAPSKPKEEKPKATVVTTQPKKSSKLMSHNDYLKKKKEDYETMMKKWPKKATNLLDGDKITKAQVAKLFPPQTECFVDSKMSQAVNLHSKLERSYSIQIKEMKNDWIAVTLVGKKHSIAWKEGPIKKKHKVCIPSIRTK